MDLTEGEREVIDVGTFITWIPKIIFCLNSVVSCWWVREVRVTNISQLWSGEEVELYEGERVLVVDCGWGAGEGGS